MGSNGEGGRSKGRNGKSKDKTGSGGLSRRTDRAVRRAARSADSASRALEEAARGSSQGPNVSGAPSGLRAKLSTASGERVEAEIGPLKAVWFVHFPDNVNSRPGEETKYIKQAVAEQFVDSSNNGYLSVRISNWPEIVEFTVELSWNGWLVDVAEPEIETIMADGDPVSQQLIYRMELA